MTRQKIIAGNWKMYKTTAEALAFAESFTGRFKGSPHEVAIAAPFTQLPALKQAFAGTSVRLAAQNVHFAEEGAYTGEISPGMLAELGLDYVVVGHSERRQYFAETDGTVNQKLAAVFAHGMTPIFCVGEVLEQRDAGAHMDIVRSQVTQGLAGIGADDAARIVIAYEPVWAIGTGRTATPAQAEEMCALIRETVAGLYGQGVADAVRIQYGGSVKPANAGELLTMDNIDGALVGGASLNPDDFMAIIDFS
ncbi:MAG: triose-phosphate isomerase [Clostridiales Family XIII bacterium]|jgi:triosephosphate isomerase|nr:triose-phosphate isomerase [Clostridiales Family XIII bacterium]